MNRLTLNRLKVNLQFRRGVKTPTIDWKPIKSSTSNVTEAEMHTKHPLFRKFILGLMVTMPIITFGLGCWQVKRLVWKNELISRAEKMLARAPLTSLPPDLDPEAVKEFEFRRFKIKGKFNYDQEIFLGPRMKKGEVGYLVIVPFERSDGGKPILVERGWISKEKVIPETRENNYLSHLSRPKGEVEIEGFFRNMPKKSSLQFDHDSDARLFHVHDVETMAQQTGSLPIYCQLLYDLSDHPEYKSKSLMEKLVGSKKDDFEMEYQEFEFIKNGVPIGTVPKVNFTNNHLQYLITWFGISLASTGLLIYSFIKMKKFKGAENLIKAKEKNMKINW